MTELAVDLRGTEESIQVLETVFVDLNTTLKTVASTMEKVVDVMSPDANAFSGVLEGVDAFNILADGRSNLEDLCEALNKGARAAEKAGEGFSVFKALIPETSAQMGGAFEPVAKIIDVIQNVFAVSWSEKFGFFGGVLDAFFANVENIWNAVKTVFQGVVQFVSSVFAGDWKGAWDGIVTIFTGIWDGIVAYLKIPINAAIGVLNGFLNHVETIVNAVIGLLNGISVEVPDWEIFGDLAGKAFGFQLAPVALPRIPLLAKGAVLPANRPFLAMVGDQRQGTNVEAPLATIQEAVALVMGDQVAAMMAGFREVVREQQALRAAVEGIEVGDEVIGRAAVRYGERMAVVKGS